MLAQLIALARRTSPISWVCKMSAKGEDCACSNTWKVHWKDNLLNIPKNNTNQSLGPTLHSRSTSGLCTCGCSVSTYKTQSGKSMYMIYNALFSAILHASGNQCHMFKLLTTLVTRNGRQNRATVTASKIGIHRPTVH